MYMQLSWVCDYVCQLKMVKSSFMTAYMYSYKYFFCFLIHHTLKIEGLTLPLCKLEPWKWTGCMSEPVGVRKEMFQHQAIEMKPFSDW